MKREELIFEIVKMEWEMFQRVNNTGGRASCQSDPDTFFRMRMSQWSVYSDALLQSYKGDLLSAWEQGRNLLTEKYGRMMKSTFPEEYEKISFALPVLTKDEEREIDEMVAIHCKWDEEAAQKYPHFRGNGRPFKTLQDNLYGGTSSETYFRGETGTYGKHTRKLLKEEMKDADQKGENLLLDIFSCEAAFYGYSSLEEAENKLSDHI